MVRRAIGAGIADGDRRLLSGINPAPNANTAAMPNGKEHTDNVSKEKMMSDTNNIIQGMLNVQRGNRRVQDPNGRNPICIPRVGISWSFAICEVCGKPIIDESAPCSAVPPDQRWSPVFEDQD